MKIIKKAKPLEPFKAIQLTCICEAVLLADKVEDFMRLRGYNQRDHEGWDYAVVKCPECDRRITVEKTKFPPHIYEALKVQS